MECRQKCGAGCCAEVTRPHGIWWAWADTCCIDKTSSAALDEAIRSMFRWYHDADMCFVYLAGTHALADLPRDRWFARGWTLQELLAPRRLKFFNSSWQPLTRAANDKLNRGPLRTLAAITHILEAQLQDFQPKTNMIREKMCWAARRETTRVEDVAYSLLGIFDVSMSMEYG